MLSLLLAAVVAQTSGDLAALETLGLDLQPPSEATLKSMVAQTMPKVCAVMKLPVAGAPKMKVVDREEAAAKIQAVLAREYPGDELEWLGRALALVGLVEPDTDLLQFAKALYARGVGGFYDQYDGTLYLLADQPGIVQQLVIAHELAHSLQDRQARIARAIKERKGSEDAQLALSAALEGHAQKVASLVISSGSGAEGELGAMLGSLGALSAEQIASEGDVPPWLGLQMSFPYGAGLALVEALATADDPVASNLIAHPPASTAAVLEPELHRRGVKPLAGAIGLAGLVNPKRVLWETTLGRANIDLLGKLAGAGPDLGSGWRGDRLEAVELAGGDAAVWSVTFTEPARAQRLAKALAALVRPSSPGAAKPRITVAGPKLVLMVGLPLEKVEAVEGRALAALR